ncbi:hypothetical protein Tu3298_000261 [Staphylococcus epidermidis]
MIKYILRDKLIFKKVQFAHKDRGQLIESKSTTLFIVI